MGGCFGIIKKRRVNIENSDWIILAGVPIFTAALTFVSNLYTSHRSFKSEVVAKNRIEWIREVRELSGEYISISFQAQRFGKKYLRVKKKGNKSAENDLKSSFFQEVYEMKRVNALLKLYFGENEDNKELLKLIDQMLITPVKELNKSRHIMEDLPIDNLVNEYTYKRMEIERKFAKEMQEYLNEQWKRAKKLEVGNK